MAERGSEMKNLKKFVWLVLAIIAAVFAAMLITLAVSGTARAETETSFTKDRTLIAKEVRYIGRFPNVPDGISPDTAFKIAKGKQAEATVIDENGSNEHSFALPWIKTRTEYMDKVVTYENDEWLVKHAPSRFKQEESIFLSIFWLWIPAALIILISVEGAFAKVAPREFFAFYGLLLVGVLASALVGSVIGTSSGEFVGASTGFGFGLLVGGIVGLFAGGVFMGKEPGLSVGAGGIAGALLAMISGAYAGAQEFKIVWNCFLFLIASEAVAFCIVLLIKSAQWKIQKITKHQECLLNINKHIE